MGDPHDDDPLGKAAEMKPYYDDGTVTIYHADCRDVLQQIRAKPVRLPQIQERA